MDLTLREEYWIKFSMKLIAVISHDNYNNSLATPVENLAVYLNYSRSIAKQYFDKRLLSNSYTLNHS
jgi:hypothetical protein